MKQDWQDVAIFGSLMILMWAFSQGDPDSWNFLFGVLFWFVIWFGTIIIDVKITHPVHRPHLNFMDPQAMMVPWTHGLDAPETREPDPQDKEGRIRAAAIDVWEEEDWKMEPRACKLIEQPPGSLVSEVITEDNIEQVAAWLRTLGSVWSDSVEIRDHRNNEVLPEPWRVLLIHWENHDGWDSTGEAIVGDRILVGDHCPVPISEENFQARYQFI